MDIDHEWVRCGASSESSSISSPAALSIGCPMQVNKSIDRSTLLAQRGSYSANLERHLLDNDFMPFLRRPFYFSLAITGNYNYCNCSRSSSERSESCWILFMAKLKTIRCWQGAMLSKRCTVNLHFPLNLISVRKVVVPLHVALR